MLIAIGSVLEDAIVKRIEVGRDSTSYVEITPTADAANLPTPKAIVLSPIEGGTNSHYYVSIAGSDEVAKFLRLGVNTNFAYGEDGWHRYQTVPIHNIGDGFAISDAMDIGYLPEGSEVEFSLSYWIDEEALAANEDYDGEAFSIGVIFENGEV
ncbi:hypothetical protein IKG33_02050 [Candidatus Saccharibacteria bacterium]|nr:hypothetical protein [Candidatus Saccharibacteria bacterium]